MKYIVIFLSLFLAISANAEGLNSPYENPRLDNNQQVIIIQHQAYTTAVDKNTLVPDWVQWQLTSDHSMGCLERINQFAGDPLIDAQFRVLPKDYQKTGFDQGHLAPADDFAWDKTVMRESFYMTNMSPQVPKLNRLEWEQLEVDTRDWAFKFGPLDIIDGPIYDSSPKTIGDTHKISVPLAFWKVIRVEGTGPTLAFIMKNIEVDKGDVTPYLVTPSEIEREAKITLNLPGVDKSKVGTLLPLNIPEYNKAKVAKCKS